MNTSGKETKRLAKALESSSYSLALVLSQEVWGLF